MQQSAENRSLSGRQAKFSINAIFIISRWFKFRPALVTAIVKGKRGAAKMYRRMNRALRSVGRHMRMAAGLLAVLALAIPTAADAQDQAPGGYQSETAHLQAIGQRLALANAERCQGAAATQGETASEQPAPVRDRCSGHFVVLPGRVLNAWADGKDVYVTSKMMDWSIGDDALAFVVAHELSHNILRHAERLKDISRQFAGPDDAARIKQTEVEADALAIELVARAGFDPTASERLLCKIVKQHLKETDAATHPGALERIAIVRTAIGELAGAPGLLRTSAPGVESGSPLSREDGCTAKSLNAT